MVGLTSLQGFGDIRALITIRLFSCGSLCRLSDMSKLTNLKVLDLKGTRVELHEENIHMLQGLQLWNQYYLFGQGHYLYMFVFKGHKLMCYRSMFTILFFTVEQIPWREIDLCSFIRCGGPSSCTRRLEFSVSGEIFGHNWSKFCYRFHYRFSCSLDRIVSKSNLVTCCGFSVVLALI